MTQKDNYRLLATILLFDRELEQQEIISSADLKADDIILIKPGEAIPADGELLKGIH